MAEGVAGRIFYDSGFTDCGFYGFLHETFVNVMTALLSCGLVEPAVFLREEPLPFEFFCRFLGAFIHSVAEEDCSESVCQVFFMQSFYFFDVGFEFWDEDFWEHHAPVLSAFSVADCDFVPVKIQVEYS